MATYASHPGGSELWQWLKGVPPFPKQLAWCHTTDAYHLRTIIKTGLFEPSPCTVFDQKLLYFFYGRPAYRSESADSLMHTAKAPVVIVLAPGLITKGTRLFPFDTGAFKSRYKSWLYPDMELSDFELACSDNAPERHVQAFFGSNLDYLQLKGVEPPPACQGSFEAESIVKLIKDESNESADDRRIAVELQLDAPIAFDASTVMALIVPDELTQATWLEAFAAGAGAGVALHTYPLAVVRRASHYQVFLEEMVAEIQKDRGLT